MVDVTTERDRIVFAVEGLRRAVIASAVIWAFWHTPYALSGIHDLDGIPALMTATIMPIVIIGQV